MGRGLVIISTAMVFIFGMIQMGISNRHNAETGINIDYAGWVHARNVAGSGVDFAAMRLISNPNWRPADEANGFHIDSTFANLLVETSLDDGSVPANQIRITSDAQFGRRNARVIAYLQQGSNIPTIDAAIGIYTEGADFTANGTAFTITGEDGQEDDAFMKYGIATGNKKVYDEVTGSIKNQQIFQVKGKGGLPSIAEVDNINKILIEQAAIYAEYAKNPTDPENLPGVYFQYSHSLAAQDSLGSEDYFQVTYVEEGQELTLTGGAKGGGILVLGQDATLTMKGGGSEPFNFYGLVIVLGSAKVRGHMNIHGALMFGGESDTDIDVEFSGNIDVSYSSAAITELNETLEGYGDEFKTAHRIVSIYE